MHPLGPELRAVAEEEEEAALAACLSVVPPAPRCHPAVLEGTEALEAVLESVPDALVEAPIHYISVRTVSSDSAQQRCTLRSLIGASARRAQPRCMLRPCWTGASAGPGVQVLLGERRVLPQVSVRRSSGLQIVSHQRAGTHAAAVVFAALVLNQQEVLAHPMAQSRMQFAKSIRQVKESARVRKGPRLLAAKEREKVWILQRHPHRRAHHHQRHR